MPTKDGVIVAVVWLVVQAGPLIRELINAPDIELVNLSRARAFTARQRTLPSSLGRIGAQRCQGSLGRFHSRPLSRAGHSADCGHDAADTQHGAHLYLAYTIAGVSLVRKTAVY